MQHEEEEREVTKNHRKKVVPKDTRKREAAILEVACNFTATEVRPATIPPSGNLSRRRIDRVITMEASPRTQTLGVSVEFPQCQDTQRNVETRNAMSRHATKAK